MGIGSYIDRDTHSHPGRAAHTHQRRWSQVGRGKDARVTGENGVIVQHRVAPHAHLGSMVDAQERTQSKGLSLQRLWHWRAGELTCAQA